MELRAIEDRYLRAVRARAVDPHLTQIFAACAKLGYLAEGDAIQVKGWPVQFLPASQPLVAEAVRER